MAGGLAATDPGPGRVGPASAGDLRVGIHDSSCEASPGLRPAAVWADRDPTTDDGEPAAHLVTASVPGRRQLTEGT